ncbi:hypothetical protein IOD16_34570 [Saccharothrix sp. 6-C]|uniref:GLTT repeat-containing protein n=1 Tax=Saccharothrix texasensis TaxID=103734 RepID=A0A3N1HBP7_9PSEU|nr:MULTISPECIES: hypothetical protein [Saccharothrix]QQQ76111.1 hypothetical protein IOD16_34570 [Saccharothrix sp. 6-C]ROP39702.1 hypothetical protein EDD40_5099 [Saccharothrix texasensis]
MRILGRLAVAAGATAVILLASPAANASDAAAERTYGAMDAVPHADLLGALTSVLGPVTGGLGGASGAAGGLGGLTGGIVDLQGIG